MTLLFVGGLFGLALLAVIGAVVLSLPDRRAATAPAAAPEAIPDTAAQQAVATARPTVPLNTYTQVSQPLPAQVSQTLPHLSQTLPATHSQPFAATPNQHLAA